MVVFICAGASHAGGRVGSVSRGRPTRVRSETEIPCRRSRKSKWKTTLGPRQPSSSLHSTTTHQNMSASAEADGVKPEEAYNHFMGFKVKPKPAGYAKDGQVVPEAKANPFSRLIFSWMTPILMVSRVSERWSLRAAERNE